MHQHQQTIADLERLKGPSCLEIAAYAAVTVAAIACILAAVCIAAIVAFAW